MLPSNDHKKRTNGSFSFHYTSTGSTDRLKQSYRRLKAYLANSFLLGRLLTDPDFRLSDVNDKVSALKKYGYKLKGKRTITVMLENMPAEGYKIDDLYVKFMLPGMHIKVEGVTVLLDDVLQFVRIPVDSKFFMNPSRIGDPRKFFQQIALTIGDRMSQLWRFIKGWMVLPFPLRN